MIKAIIIEDELHSSESIKMILDENFSNLEIINQVTTVKDAVDEIREKDPELLFLDVDLPDGTSFDILKQVDYSKYKLIFITAHQEYALNAIKFSAFDYILKPFEPIELVQTVNKVINEKINEDYELKFQAFFDNFNGTTACVKKVILKTLDKIHIVDVKDIVRCQSENTYTKFYLNNGQKILVSKNLKQYEELMTEYGFMRVHQSHLINLNYISYLDKTEGGSIVMSDKSHIPISGKKRVTLFTYLDNL